MSYQEAIKLVLGIIGSGIVACVAAYEITKPRGG